MIINFELYEESNQKQKIACICDYCGSEFQRLKHNLQRSRKHIIKDSCSNVICVQKKRVEVNQLLFGVSNPFQNELIKQKIEKKNLDNFGVSNAMQSSIIKEKHKKSIQEKYKVDNVFKLKNVKSKYSKKFTLQVPEFMQTCIDNSANHYDKTQLEIQNWLNSFGFNFKSNRDLIVGREIDLYDENKKLAIEYCGLHWHHEFSPEPRDNNYHFNKYKGCLDKGVQLLTIFSDEWEKREKQCKSHIKAILGIFDKRIYARKCKIKELDKAIGRQFFADNHIQGANSLGIVFFGLIYEDELMGVMSLGRHNRQYNNLVLDRLCFKDGVQVVGGASRLFNCCVRWARANNYTDILSFSDNRWSLGKVYGAMNFRLELESRADYSYVDVKRPNERISKQSQKKSETGCPANIREIDWAHHAGLARIWDCGKKRWIYSLN